jgi:hypothetical protein
MVEPPTTSLMLHLSPGERSYAEDFEGFNVVVADGYNMMCTQRIRGLEVTLGNYMLTDDFYIMDLADTHVVLGV